MTDLVCVKGGHDFLGLRADDMQDVRYGLDQQIHGGVVEDADKYHELDDHKQRQRDRERRFPMVARSNIHLYCDQPVRGRGHLPAT